MTATKELTPKKKATPKKKTTPKTISKDELIKQLEEENALIRSYLISYEEAASQIMKMLIPLTVEGPRRSFWNVLFNINKVSKELYKLETAIFFVRRHIQREFPKPINYFIQNPIKNEEPAK